jgi:hypothetical protein
MSSRSVRLRGDEELRIVMILNIVDQGGGFLFIIFDQFVDFHGPSLCGFLSRDAAKSNAYSTMHGRRSSIDEGGASQKIKKMK